MGKAAVQNRVTFYSLVMVIVACFEKEKYTEVKTFPKMIFVLVSKEGKDCIALFLSCGLGDPGGGEMVYVSVYKRFS